MKIFALVLTLAIGCINNGDGGSTGSGSGAGSGSGGGSGGGGGGQPTETCLGGNNCVCPGLGDCFHTCSSGAAECHVQGGQEAVHVTCDANAECHVECADAATCAVDCGGSAECHVTCPPTGCEVTACVGDCLVSCGNTNQASRSGTTASCP